MRTKLKLFSLSLIVVLLLCGFYTTSVHTAASNTTTLLVTKADGVWRVFDATDTTNTHVKVKKNDTIIWEVNGTDAYFQFPDQIFNAVDKSDSLAGGYTKFVKAGHKLKLKIRGDAPAGTYAYAVFCTAGGVFARGGSPPIIIVN